MISLDDLSAFLPVFAEPDFARALRCVDIDTGRVYRINEGRTAWVEVEPHETAGRTLAASLEADRGAHEQWARAEARTHVPPAGGMTRDEIGDVYADDPGKQQALLRELDG